MPNAFVGAIKKAFPFISAAASLGGPFGVMAASVVGKAIGADKVDSSSDSISNAIASAMASPEQRQALLKAEQDFQAQMAELGYKNAEDMDKIAADDRADARAREVALKDWYPKVLATVVVLLCFFGEGMYFRFGAPANAAPELIGRILGTLDAALILVLGYYFGSSAGSAAKDSTLANIASGK